MKAQILMVSWLVFGVASAAWAEEHAKDAPKLSQPKLPKRPRPPTAKDEPIKPIEAATPKDAGMVELGKNCILTHAFPSPVSFPATLATT